MNTSKTITTTGVAGWPLTDEQRQIVQLCRDSRPRRSGPAAARWTRPTS